MALIHHVLNNDSIAETTQERQMEEVRQYLNFIIIIDIKLVC